MDIHLGNEEAERLLAEIAARKAKDRVEVLLELLRAERQRLAVVLTNASTGSEPQRESSKQPLRGLMWSIPVVWTRSWITTSMGCRGDCGRHLGDRRHSQR
jgi:hypothetical protein